MWQLRRWTSDRFSFSFLRYSKWRKPIRQNHRFICRNNWERAWNAHVSSPTGVETRKTAKKSVSTQTLNRWMWCVLVTYMPCTLRTNRYAAAGVDCSSSTAFLPRIHGMPFTMYGKCAKFIVFRMSKKSIFPDAMQNPCHRVENLQSKRRDTLSIWNTDLNIAKSFAWIYPNGIARKSQSN